MEKILTIDYITYIKFILLMEYSRIKTSIYLILLSKRNIPIFMPFLLTKDLSDYGTNRIAVSVTKWY